jgi:Mn-containing catalase
LDGDEKLGHAYVADSGKFRATGNNSGPDTTGFDLAQNNSDWGFELDQQPVDHGAKHTAQA